LASVPVKLLPAFVPATVLLCASVVTKPSPEAIFAAVTEASGSESVAQLRTPAVVDDST
jgi:hypothetical protein